MPRWAVFLDRDGTLIDEVGHLSRAEDLKLIPGAPDAVKRLRAAGAAVVVVTNQAVVARGLIDEDGLKRVHEKLEALFAAEGALFDAIYYCPHHPEKDHADAQDPKYRRECDCRKPKPGMLTRAAAKADIDLAGSFMIGDRWRDIEAGRRAGCRTVLIGDGYGETFTSPPDARFSSLTAAADWILAHPETRGHP